MFASTTEVITMDLSVPQSLAAIIASVVGVGVIVFRALRPMLRRIRLHMRSLDSIPQLVVDVKAISDQVHPNGGSSLKDVVDRIETRQLHDSQVLGSFLASQNVAFFRTDIAGKFTDASRPLCKLLQRSESELLGNFWLSWVDQQVRDEVSEEWMDAIRNEREFDKKFALFSDEGERIYAHARAYLLLDSKRKPMGYFGTFTKTATPE